MEELLREEEILEEASAYGLRQEVSRFASTHYELTKISGGTSEMTWADHLDVAFCFLTEDFLIEKI